MTQVVIYKAMKTKNDKDRQVAHPENGNGSLWIEQALIPSKNITCVVWGNIYQGQLQAIQITNGLTRVNGSQADIDLMKKSVPDTYYNFQCIFAEVAQKHAKFFFSLTTFNIYYVH